MINKLKESKRIIIGTIIITFIVSPFSFLFAEDYPAGYLGEGYREYLKGKIQNGYYIDVFTKIDGRQKEQVNKRNQIEQILTNSYLATPVSSNGILYTTYEQKENSSYLNATVAERRREREKVASVQGEFNYIKHTDGKVEYFKDGLVSRVENERVLDEFGNVSYRNSYNYKYNDDRLLMSFEADIKDNLGNTTHIRQFGMKYTPDSVFYATDKTNANKNIIEYTVEEINHAGNKKETHFYGGVYAGKFLRAFSQTIEDSIYGKTSFTRTNINYADNNPRHASSYHEEGIGADNLAYALDRTNTTYNGDKDQLTGYNEVTITTQIDGTKTKTSVDAKFKYLGVANQFGPDVEEPQPDQLLESIITQTVENADGSQKTETITTTYKYEGNKLIGASGLSEFNGQEAKWYEYKNNEGHILSRNEDKNGNVTYSYVDPDTLETIDVRADQVTATLKDGNKFKGTSEIQYEILYGRPMDKEVHSFISYYNPEDGNLFRSEDSILTYNNGLINNLLRVLSSQEYTEIHYPFLDPDKSHIETNDINTTYTYDDKGNLLDAYGEGTKKGYEYSSERGWWGKDTSPITIDYEVILGKALRKTYHEDKDYE